MYPPSYTQSEFCCDDKSYETTGLYLNLGHIMPDFSVLEDDCTARFDFDETRSHKRVKQAPSATVSNGNGAGLYCTGSNGRTSTNSLNIVPRLHFRDYVLTYTERYLAIEAMEEATAALMDDERNEVIEEEGGDGMKLLQQLIACAEAVACRDKTHASALLSELGANALVFGTSFQRVAPCFVQGSLIVGVLGSPAKTVTTFTAEKDEALRLVYEICPQIQFGHFVANSSILEAFEGKRSVHVVDLGMTLGLSNGQQWRNLIHSIANRTGQPPHRLRITGVGNSAERLRVIGDELESYARSLGLKFEFLWVESSLENLKPTDFKLLDGEVVIINSILQLHCVVKESRGALNSVLQMLLELSPKLLILVEQDSSHNGPFFLGRFMEALHYYSAIFDSLDAMLPKYDTRRAKIEQFFFAEEIKNIISCEGPARVERHERVDQWRRRISRAGFQPSHTKMTMLAKQWLGKAKFCEGYAVTEEKGCLVLGWKSKPIIAASCWKCS
ncbi:hypothetical protein P3X46_011586 [Hevea brasiliensis]|uniref:DELLA protein RGL1-like n=1 Tax=Hevea brasiliensis TaxID=3981 RepID=A0ABQ9M7J1_HEVBR|nr:hypothetical protein P3X46_011586 [Hevea brasiliensis]